MIGSQNKRRSPLVLLQVIFLVLIVCTFIATVILLAAMDRVSTSSLGNRAQASEEFDAAMVEPTPRSTQPWLLFGIPTVERSTDELNPTLDAIAAQMLPENDPKVSVMILKNSEDHSGFDLAKKRFKNRTEFIFVENTERLRDTEPLGADIGDDRHPSWKVQKHSLDLVFMMEFANANLSPNYFLFMEDDFSLCTDALKAIIHLIEKANRHFPDWMGLLFGEGMNGIVLKRQDLREFASYLKEHLARRPPDHLIIEWLAGETEQSERYRQDRPHVTFRYNLLQHRGRDSTLREAKAFIMDTCYHVNDDRRMFEVVSFKADQCGHDDIWPCSALTESSSVDIDSHLNLNRLTPNIF